MGTVRSMPKADIKWYKDDKELKFVTNMKFYSEKIEGSDTDIKYWFDIASVAPEDLGKFTIKATNPVGEAKIDANLAVSVPPKFHPWVSLKLPVDCTATAVCKLDGVPKPTLEWFKGEKKLEMTGRYSCGFTDGIVKLSIKDAKENDKGTYSVIAKNKCGMDKNIGDFVFQAAPVILKELKSIRLMEGSDLTFESKISGTPVPKITWYKDDREIIPGDGLEIFNDHNSKLYRLLIREAVAEDAGTYKVKAMNVAGKAETSGALSVAAAPILSEPLKDIEENEHAQAMLVCEIDGLPPPTFKWTKDGNEMKPTHRINAVRDGQSTYKLEFRDLIGEEDDGVYEITATNDEGSVTSSARVTVKGAPQVKRPVKSVEIKENEKIFMECTVTGFPEPECIWTKNGNPIEDPRVKIKSEKGKAGFVHTIEVAEAQFDHCGKYRLEATNKWGNCFTEAPVAVHVPPVVKVPLTDKEGHHHKQLILECNIHGFPHPDIKWFKNGKEIKQTKEMVFKQKLKEGSYQVIFKDPLPMDSGKYKIHAQNPVGECFTECNLNITCPPFFEKQLKDVELSTGKTIQMDCTCLGTPDPTMQWFKDDQPLQLDGDRVRVKSEKNNHMLIMTKTTEADAGCYKVVGTNDAGTAECLAWIAVFVGPSFEKPLPEKLDAVDGENALLEVKVKGIPTPDVTWFKDGKAVKRPSEREEEDVEYENPEPNVHRLILPKAFEKDAGKYSAKAMNKIGKAETTTTLAIGMPPKIKKSYKDAVTKEGENVNLDLEVTGVPTPQVQWFHKDKLIETGDKFKVEDNDGSKFKHKLTIFKSDPSDDGVIKVLVKNKFGEKTHQAKIGCVKAAKIVQPTKDCSAELGTSTTFHVIVDGMPTPTVQWSKDGKDIFDKPGKYTTKVDGLNYYLTIENIEQKDLGFFICKAANNVGQDECKAQLKAAEPKSEPVFEGADGDLIIPETAVQQQAHLKSLNAKQKTLPDAELKDQDPQLNTAKIKA